MALLDNIFGGSGGWLGPQVGTTPDFQQQFPSVSFDWLRQLLSQNGGYASGAPSDVSVAGLQPNIAGPASFNDRFGNLPPAGVAPLPPPVNVPSLKVASAPEDTVAPPAAQPIQYQPQAQTQQPISPYPADASGGGLGGGLRGFIANAHTGPIGAILGGVAGVAGMGAGNPQTNIARAVYQTLAPKLGADRALAIAQMAATDPKFAQTIMPHALGLNPPKNLEELIARTAAGEKFNGVGEGGGTLANAMKLQADFLKNKTAAEAIGKEQGAVAGTLPNAKATLDQSLSLIDDIKNDPNLPYVVGGPVVGRNPGLTGQQNATIAKIDQLQGQLVTNIMQGFKDTGIRLTQQEVNQIQRGAARLVRTQDLPSFQKAADELRAQVYGLRTRLGEMAGGEPTPPTPGSIAPSFTQDQLRAEARRRGLIQ